MTIQRETIQRCNLIKANKLLPSSKETDLTLKKLIRKESSSSRAFFIQTIRSTGCLILLPKNGL
jgi:hypothetical protein